MSASLCSYVVVDFRLVRLGVEHLAEHLHLFPVDNVHFPSRAPLRGDFTNM